MVLISTLPQVSTNTINVVLKHTSKACSAHCLAVAAGTLVGKSNMAAATAGCVPECTDCGTPPSTKNLCAGCVPGYYTDGFTCQQCPPIIACNAAL